ncbi:hypothetical protein JXA80_12840, partial [bacterium]|nr:hypothetical protein [candidate division CSSED10-310 bacterium]
AVPTHTPTRTPTMTPTAVPTHTPTAPPPTATPVPPTSTPNPNTLTVGDGEGCQSETVTLVIVMDNPDTPVDALLIELDFDPTMLVFGSCEAGDLTAGWDMFNCNEPVNGTLSIAGFTSGAGIPAGSLGNLVDLHFTINCPTCSQGDMSDLIIVGLDDDVAGFQAVSGAFTYSCSGTPEPTVTPDCIRHGDVNLNGSISAGDAQLAFNIVLGLYSPSYQEACAADCNGDGNLTASDAQSIFYAVLGTGGCVDPLP